MSVDEAYKDYVNAVADAMRDRCARGMAVRAYVSNEDGSKEDAQEFDVWLMDAPMPPRGEVPHFDPKQTPVIRLPLSAVRGPGTMRSYMPLLNVFYNTFSDVYVHHRYFYDAHIVHVALLQALFALLHKDGILTIPVPLVAVEHVSERALQQYVALGLLLAPTSDGGAYRINPHSAYLYMYEFIQTGPFRVPSARDVLEHTLHVVEQLEPSCPLLFYVQDPQSKLLTPAARHNITWRARNYVRAQRKVVRAPMAEQTYTELRQPPPLPPVLKEGANEEPETKKASELIATMRTSLKAKVQEPKEVEATAAEEEPEEDPKEEEATAAEEEPEEEPKEEPEEQPEQEPKEEPKKAESE
jgi:hypothetical protein